MAKKVFITGASGCVGHYIVELLITKTDYELYLLVRDRQKLKIEVNNRSGIHVLEGTMQHIAKYQDLLSDMNYVISTAAAWGGTEITFDTNLYKTLELFSLVNPLVCEKAIYFSTASILDEHNQLLAVAGEIGTDYIRSKYQCLKELEKSAISDRLFTVFPTLVFGGDRTGKPYSHLSGGLKEVASYLNLIRWIKGDGSFHFIHGSDIAQIINQLITANDSRLSWDLDGFEFPVRLVLGEPSLTVNQAIAEACDFFDKPLHKWMPKFNLTPWLVDVVIQLFKIKVGAWDRFCLNQRHFTYKVVSPETFGLRSKYPNIASLLADVD